MGVHNLWKLLAPCGHRVSIDTLTTSRLAVDVSIWLIQFLKGIRDPSGAPTPNAHLLGLLRRLLRLLFHGIRPIFVFDGPAPRLKKQTISMRKQARQQYTDSAKRMAEKILLAQLKIRSVQQLRKKLAEKASAKQKAEGADSNQPKAKKKRNNPKQQASSKVANTGSDAANAIDVDLDDEEEEEEKKGVPVEQLPSESLKIEEDDFAWVNEEEEMEEKKGESTEAPEPSPDVDAPPDLPEFSSDEESGEVSRARGEHDEEMFVLPADGKVDAAVLAKLPISLQYQVMQQQREHNRFHNFHKFSAVEHDPSAFSDLQMAGFLKSVKFSQSIDALRQEMNLTVGPTAAVLQIASPHLKQQADAKKGMTVDHGAASTGASFVYYKSSNAAASNGPFAWREHSNMKQKKMKDSAFVRKGKGSGFKSQFGGSKREVYDVDEDEEMEDEPVENQTNMRFGVAGITSDDALEASKAPTQFIGVPITSHLTKAKQNRDDDWLCHNCAGVNTGLAKLKNEALKDVCQTCGEKREDELEPEEEIAIVDPRLPAQSNVKRESGVAPAAPITTRPSQSFLTRPTPGPAAVADMKQKQQQRKQQQQRKAKKAAAVAKPWVAPMERFGGNAKSAPNSDANPPTTSLSTRLSAEDQLYDQEEEEAKEEEEEEEVWVADEEDEMPALETSAGTSSKSATTLASSIRTALEDKDAISCSHCTFINPISATVCKMCEQPLEKQDAALVGGPSALAASFQDKAKRRLNDLAKKSVENQIEQQKQKKTSPGTTPPRAAPPQQQVPGRTSSVSGGIEIEFDTSAAGKHDEVDNLFSSLLAAKTIQPTSIRPSLVAAKKPLQKPATESITIVDDERPARVAPKSTPAPPQMSAARQKEEEDIRKATQLSLQLQASRTSKRAGGGFSIHAAPAANPAKPASEAKVDTVDGVQVMWPSNSSSNALDMTDDNEWVQDEGEAEPSTETLPITPAQPVPAEASTSDEAVGMDIDSDSEEAPFRHPTPPVVEPPPAQPQSAPPAPPTPQKPKAVPVAALPPRPPSPAIDFLMNNVTSLPIAASPESPVPSPEPSPQPVLSAAKASAPIMPETNDSLLEPQEEDDEDILETKQQVERLMVEIKEIEAEIEESFQTTKALEPEDEEDNAPQDEAKKAQEVLVLAENDKDVPAASEQATTTTAAETPIIVSQTTPNAAVQLPFGLSMSDTPLPSSRAVAHNAFLAAQREKRDKEAAEAAARQEAEDRRAMEEMLADLPPVDAVFMQPPQDAPPVPVQLTAVASTPQVQPPPPPPLSAVAPGQSLANEAPMVYEAFPSHLTSSEAIALAQSFDSSYLESRDAHRDAANAARLEAVVTEEMLAESKELLQLFGFPYIEAPGEAEAQCAMLEMSGFVDGIITEDSDVFLFGATRCYKNFFESKKFCEKYHMEEIGNKFGLNRLKLIHMALLLGSDYTTGVKGVGIVNATEIISAFPTENGLEQLRDWIYSPLADQEPMPPNYPDDCTPAERQRLDQEYRTANFKFTHRNIKRNWSVSREFPNREIIDAYLHPNVDDCKDPEEEEPDIDKSNGPFSWSQPDWEAIARLAADKFRWDEREIELELAPVRRQMEIARQTALDKFFAPDDQFAVIASDRLKRAVKGLAKGQLSEEERGHQQAQLIKKAVQAEKKKAQAEARKQKRAQDKQQQQQPTTGTSSYLDDDDAFELSAEDMAKLQQIEASHATTSSPAKSPTPLASVSATKIGRTASNAKKLTGKKKAQRVQEVEDGDDDDDEFLP